jgi:hypothetical protein
LPLLLTRGTRTPELLYRGAPLKLSVLNSEYDDDAFGTVRIKRGGVMYVVLLELFRLPSVFMLITVCHIRGLIGRR